MGKRIIELGDDDRGPHGPKRAPWDTAPRLTGETVAEYFEPENGGAKVTRDELKFFLQRLATHQKHLTESLPGVANAAVEASAGITVELMRADSVRGRAAHLWRQARAQLRAWRARP